MEIVLHNCNIQVMTNQEGQKVIIFIDPGSKIKIIVPMVDEAAKKIAQALTGASILVPQFVPPHNMAKKNGN